MIRLFCGHEPRENPGLHVFIHSVLKRSSKLVAFIPLNAAGLDEGSNSFTLSRFLVPSLCNYEGRAIFCDASDMLSLADIGDLDDQFDENFAAQVVKHPAYTSEHYRKYVGTGMECAQSNYDRKNWASVMLINCAHPAWSFVDKAFIASQKPLDMLQLNFIPDSQIGDISQKWNVLVDEGQGSNEAAILHWTAGIPGFWHYQNARRAQDWHKARSEMEGR